MDLRGKTFLVIGGAGLIGSHTIDLLLRHGVTKIIVFDNFIRGRSENLQDALLDERCSIYPIGGDVLQTDILDSVFTSTKIDGVFHFAALWLLQCHDYPRSAFNTNVLGTYNVIEACIKHNVSRLVYSSSASVYGDAVSDPIGESHPFNNKNFYGATKICGEAMLRALHHRYGLNFVGLRYMNVYGPRQDYNGAYIAVIMKMLDAIDKGESPIILGDGSEAFDFIAVEDCAKANICAMQSEVSDEFYNVGTGVKTSLREVAEALLKLTDTDVAIRYEPRSTATLVKNRVGCPQKAANEIGFCAEISLEEGLRRLIAWRAAHKSSLAALHLSKNRT